VQLHHAMIASTLSRWQKRADNRSILSGIAPGWRNNFYQSIQDIYVHGNEEQLLSYRYASGRFTINIDDQEYSATIIKVSANEIHVEIDGVRTAYALNSAFIERKISKEIKSESRRLLCSTYAISSDRGTCRSR